MREGDAGGAGGVAEAEAEVEDQEVVVVLVIWEVLQVWIILLYSNYNCLL
jgi:hypothetical protein